MNEPSALRLTDPLAGLEFRIDDRASPSTSLSFPRMPAAPIASAVSSPVTYASLAATGASLTGVTVIVTVSVFDVAGASHGGLAQPSGSPRSVTVNVNASVPL